MNFARFQVTLAALTAPLTLQAQGPQPGLPGRYDPDNLLARTARGEVPSVKLYDDDKVMAFLADRPAARGHFLIILKRGKARNFLEVSSRDMRRVMDVARLVAAAEIKAIGAQGFTLRQNNGSASSVVQYHLHVIPRWPGDKLPEGVGAPVPLEALQDDGKRIRDAIARR